MTTREDIRTALRHPNVIAFLRVIRAGESNQDDSAYRLLYGGGFFASFDGHPRQAIHSPWGWTSAAGAYQIMAAVPGKVKTDTWDRIAAKYGFEDFTPATQDEAAVALIAERGALYDLLRGDLSEVLDKVSYEWASLPPGRYGQPTMDAKRVYAVFEQWLPRPTESPEPGQSAPPAGDQPPVATPVPPTEKKMPAPFVFTAATALLPFVIDLFRGHGSKTSIRNADIIERAGPAMVEIAKVVTGQPTEQQAAEAVLGNPTLQTEFRRAVEADLDRLVGMIERVVKMEDDSRDKAAERAAKAPVDFAPVLIRNQFNLLIALAAATIVAFIVALSLKASNEILVGLMVLFTGLVNSTASKWATMIEYRFGSSAGSEAKNVLLSERK